jgi:hypothetical protein
MRRHAGFTVLTTTILSLVLTSPPASAQAPNVGAGPLTGSLADAEPTVGTVKIGLVSLAPGLVIRELGWDDNVFGEPVDPKEDFVASIAPDVAAFTRLRFLQLSAYGGGIFNYFQTYDQERSVGHNVRARADILLSRVRPFVAGGRARSRTRPNGEIDVRADRLEEEISGGVAFDISRYGVVYGAASRLSTKFRDAFEDGVNLALTLNRDTYQYSGGVRTELTPFLAMTVAAGYIEDKFRADPIRNADSRQLTVNFRIAPQAVVSGQVMVGVNDFKPVHPDVRPFRGLIAEAAIVYPFLEVGRLGIEATRRNEFSFDAEDAYFIDNTIGLSYTHRLFGGADAQVKGTKSWFDYGFTPTSPARQDTLDLAAGSVGYNLQNRTRISVNYEYSRRSSPQLPERNYDRRRAFLAWSFAY